MFKQIQDISDIQPFVADKSEIRFSVQPNGITIGCYMFMDSHTFDSAEALECRGIAFDASGAIVSRPLHKFFNVGEKEWLSLDKVLARDDVTAIYEKLDGSMIATAWVNGELLWRSKKAFSSDVVLLAERFLESHENIREFAARVASQGMTAIFELTHPEAQIVVNHAEPELRLLHVRDNVSGEYVMLDMSHRVHEYVAVYGIQVVRKFSFSVSGAMDSLPSMSDCEGYVIQFKSGDMAKVKCPWYARLHRSVTFLRERDIAALALAEELDDVKSSLIEIGITLEAVDAVEARLKAIITGINDEIEGCYQAGAALDRKSFAIANKSNPIFGLIMSRYLGQEVNIIDWYRRARLKEDFSLRSLASAAVAEAIDG